MNPTFHPQSVCPSTNFPPSHLPHTETHQWGPHPSSSLSSKLCPTWATHITLGHPFLYLYISPQLFVIYCTNAFIFSHYITLFSSPLATCFPLFGQSQPMSPLVGELLIIFPCWHCPYLQSTLQVTYLYPLDLFTFSCLWHNLSPVLSSP
jgi:hypothetical protein